MALIKLLEKYKTQPNMENSSLGLKTKKLV